MLYFAYGSNMCTGRLCRRVPSATSVSVARLAGHSLRLHKRSIDKSGKCDAYFTGEPQDIIWGVLYQIDPNEKRNLDRAEGYGYRETQVTVVDTSGEQWRSIMYVANATHIDAALRPYSWYKRFVVEGARIHMLPADYIEILNRIETTEDQDEQRDAESRSISC